MHIDLLDELAIPPHLIVVRGRRRIQRLAHKAYSKGQLIRLLPGVYALPGTEGLQAQAIALAAAHPDAVIHGRAAAALTWWPELAAPEVAAVVKHELAPAAGFRFVRGAVPPELILESNGIRLTTPALTVLDLIPELGGNPIDEALRRGAADLPALWEAMALSPNRPGNQERRWLLEDSRDEPWSPAERHLHRLFRALDLPWRYETNHHRQLLTCNAYLDLALPALRLAFEVDGYTYHSDRTAFRRDRRRDPELVELAWVVVRFDAQDLLDDPEWVTDRITGIVAARAVELGLHR